jgi:hypothetical protein
MIQVVERLPSKHETPSSNPSTGKTEKRRKEMNQLVLKLSRKGRVENSQDECDLEQVEDGRSAS